MLDLSPELSRLRDDGLLDDAVAAPLIARERREVFSVYPELRALSWLGAMLVATAAGIVIKNNLDRLGPAVITLLIAVAATACYAWSWFRRTRVSLVDDYVLLLGALLVSADVAFIESQWQPLGAHWSRHFALLAIVHGVTAYLFDSRLVLSLSIGAMAAWIGIERSERIFLRNDVDTSTRFFAAAMATLVWRQLDLRFRARRTFERLFEHAAATFALIGGLVLAVDQEVVGSLVALAIAAIVIAWGFRVRAELFVLYGFVCAVIAFNILLLHVLRDEALGLLMIVGSMFGAIAGLFVIHAKFPRGAK